MRKRAYIAKFVVAWLAAFIVGWLAYALLHGLTAIIYLAVPFYDWQ